MTKQLSENNHKRLETQGFVGHSNAELAEYQFGIRFAYITCSTIVIMGVLSASIPLLALAGTIAALAVILPRHPADYAYNQVAQRYGKPAIPKRPAQSKFACGIATVWLMSIIILFSQNEIAYGRILGGLLLAVAILVASTDFCIPSVIYNFIFKFNPESTNSNASTQQSIG